jgi:hypothetical protein
MKTRTVRFLLVCLILVLAGPAVVLELAAHWGGLAAPPEPAGLASISPYYTPKKDGRLRFLEINDGRPAMPDEAPYPEPDWPAQEPPEDPEPARAYDDWVAPPEPEVAPEPLYEKTVKQWAKYEATFQLSWTFANPYDPDEIAIDALVTLPGGAVETMPAFWYVPCRNRIVDRQRPSANPEEDTPTIERIETTGPGTWMLRYTPRREGVHRYRLVARTPETSAVSEEVTFNVAGTSGRGFVRVSRADRRYFEFDDGSFFFPIGQNVAWANDLGSVDFRLYMVDMANVGANWARIWLTHFFQGQILEWSPQPPYFHGLGFYSPEMAWKLDRMLEHAEENGIYLMWCLQHHGPFSTRFNAEWDANPYNKQKGGFLDAPEQFFTHPRARQLVRRRLRYCIARYGYSPHLFAWELWNEVSLTDRFSDGAVTAWHHEMAEYLKTTDPSSRMVSTSYGGRFERGAYALPELDFVQVHIYHSDTIEWMAWLLRSVEDQMRTVESEREFGKPVLIGEYGLGHSHRYFRLPEGPEAPRWPVDPHGLHVHNSLWIGLFSGSAGTAMNWWWDRYIRENDLLFHFRGISRFLAGEDLRAGDLKRVILFQRFYRTPEYLCYALAGPERAYGWLFETGYTIKNFAPGDRPREGVEIELDGLRDGECWIEFWDTYDGVVIARRRGRVDLGRLAFTVPPFHGDIAFKVLRREHAAEITVHTPLHDRMVRDLRDLARKVPRQQELR